jgi:hypothetical protein
MKYFQLFTEKPGMEFVASLLRCYGLQSLDDNKEFCKEDLTDYGTIDKLEELIPEMILYYLPCKSEIYLKDITVKRSITILTQFLRLYEYKLVRKERIINRKKHIYYNLISNKFNNIHISTESTEVDFA